MCGKNLMYDKYFGMQNKTDVFALSVIDEINVGLSLTTEASDISSFLTC
jgi:hypothetical protein